jgi:branched-chain amino acid transport system permease protein
MLYREAGDFKTTYVADMQTFPIRGERILFWLFVAFCFGVVPFFITGYWEKSIIVPFLVWSMIALGLNILTGYCGQVSLGTGGFMAVGAFACYKLTTAFPELNIVLVIILSGAVTAGVGMLFGLPSLRIKGFYLAVTGPDAPPWATYLVSLTFVFVFAWVARNLTRGRLGRSWMAMRDMDIAAQIMGISPFNAKLSAFAISSFYVGMGGAMFFAIYLGAAEVTEAFGIDKSFDALFMIIIGGLGSILGSFLGAAFIVVFPVFLKNVMVGGLGWSTDLAAHIEIMTVGALIIFFLIVEPHGLAQIWRLTKEKLRLWPFPY